MFLSTVRQKLLGTSLGRGQGISTGGDLKAKFLLRLPLTLGAFNWALRHRCIYFAPRKKSYTISPLQCRGMRGRD